MGDKQGNKCKKVRDLCVLAAVSQAEYSFKWPVDDTDGGCYLILLFGGHDEWTPKDLGLTIDIKPKLLGTRGSQ